MLEMIAAILLLTGPKGQSLASYGPDWEHIQPGGWTVVGVDGGGDTMLLTQAVEGHSSRLWIREERSFYQESRRTLYEFDCNQGRARPLRVDNHREPNLGGEADTSTNDRPWVELWPDSFVEIASREICGR
ncbi:surface-adhesin E family protein [Brevundimonas sp.]|uniref:surface-adhesin E family protein n=1 Tax=Brevundimonas sp. TaxID=1871086 RepID=UPI00391B2287